MKIKGWKDITPGGLVTEPGCSVAYETGTWRSSRPIRDEERCNSCLVCWIHCPDGAIQVENSRVVGVDLTHCKGCGICAAECPRKAIKMVDESEVRVGVAR